MQARKSQMQMISMNLIIIELRVNIARKIAGNIFFVKKTLKKEKIKHIENRTFFCEKKGEVKICRLENLRRLSLINS